MTMNIHWLVHKPHSPNIACLLELWNVQLNEQLKPQMRGKLCGWGAVFRDSIFTLNQRTLYSTVPLIGKIQGPRNQKVEAGVALLTIITKYPWGTLIKGPGPQKGANFTREHHKSPMSYDCCLEIWSKKKSHHLGRNNWIGSSGRDRTAVIQWRMGEIHVGPSGITWRPRGNPLPL